MNWLDAFSRLRACGLPVDGVEAGNRNVLQEGYAGFTIPLLPALLDAGMRWSLIWSVGLDRSHRRTRFDGDSGRSHGTGGRRWRTHLKWTANLTISEPHIWMANPSWDSRASYPNLVTMG